jgi:hypothetical protein
MARHLDPKPPGRDFSTENGTKVFIKKLLDKTRRSFVASGGNWTPVAVILARFDPSENPPEILDPPKLMVMPMPKHMEFGNYMGIVSSTAASWKAASVFFTVGGYLHDRDGKKDGHWCCCEGCKQGGRPVLLSYFEHEKLPRRAWYAETDGGKLGPWEPLPYPTSLTIAFDRLN